MILSNVVLATGKSVLTTSAATSYAITSAFFCNTSSSGVEILNLFLVPNGSAAGIQNQIISNLSIQPTDTFVLDTEKLILENGDFLYATSSTGNISAVLSVMDIT